MLEESDSLSIEDPYLNTSITLACDRPCSFYLHHISTVSQSEKGVDLTLQGIAIAIKVPMQSALHFKGSITFKELA